MVEFDGRMAFEMDIWLFSGQKDYIAVGVEMVKEIFDTQKGICAGG